MNRSGGRLAARIYAALLVLFPPSFRREARRELTALRVSATDPVTYVGVPVLLVAVALVATGLPAWRATRVSPVRALRAE